MGAKFKKVSKNDIFYFCNGAGDVFWHDDEGNCIDVDAVGGVEDEHIPAPLRRAYNEAWTEGAGYPAYIAEIEGKPFLFLCDEWFDSRDRDSQKEHLCSLHSLLDYIRRLLGCKELDGCTVFFPEDTDTPFCQWEFMVAMPAETVTLQQVNKVSAAMARMFDRWTGKILPRMVQKQVEALEHGKY